MTRNFALAASIAALMTISGQALAQTVTPDAWHEPQAANASIAQTVDTFGRTAAMQTAGPDAYHYHGGPKVND